MAERSQADIFRSLAREAQAAAQEIDDPAARVTMLEIAMGYAKLAALYAQLPKPLNIEQSAYPFEMKKNWH